MKTMRYHLLHGLQHGPRWIDVPDTRADSEEKSFDKLPEEIVLVILKMAAAKTGDRSYDRDFLVDVISDVSARFRRLATDSSLWKGEQMLIRLRRNIAKTNYIVNECLSEETKVLRAVGEVELSRRKSVFIECVTFIHHGDWTDFPCQHLYDLNRIRPGKSILIWSSNAGGVSSSFESIGTLWHWPKCPVMSWNPVMRRYSNFLCGWQPSNQSDS